MFNITVCEVLKHGSKKVNFEKKLIAESLSEIDDSKIYGIGNIDLAGTDE